MVMLKVNPVFSEKLFVKLVGDRDVTSQVIPNCVIKIVSPTAVISPTLDELMFVSSIVYWTVASPVPLVIPVVIIAFL